MISHICRHGISAGMGNLLAIVLDQNCPSADDAVGGIRPRRGRASPTAWPMLDILDKLRAEESNLLSEYKVYNSGIPIGSRPVGHHPTKMGTVQEPWYTRKSIEFLANYLTKDMHIFEYGAGSSTAWFALRVGSVISVEHEASWKEEVIDKLPKNITNVTIIGCPLGAEYVSSIDPFDDNKFDLICIDGRMRSKCIFNSLNKVRPGGYLLVDNAERAAYQGAIKTIPADWEKFEFTAEESPPRSTFPLLENLAVLAMAPQIPISAIAYKVIVDNITMLFKRPAK